jgi:mono/diheme cytochrome c family protein
MRCSGMFLGALAIFAECAPAPVQAAEAQAPSASPGGGNPAAGRAFALQTCTPCHVVVSDQLSPRRFATGPDFKEIANTPGQTAMALTVWLTATPHPTMPNLVLTSDEAQNVIAYILSLRDPQR